MKELINRYPILESITEDIDSALKILTECFESGGKLIICGNGGSCADSDHIVGELMKGFLSKRPLSSEKREEMKRRCPSIDEDTLNKLQGALPAIALSSLTALNTAFSNDVDADLVYAQALYGLAKENDVLLGISTSGNSKNVVKAMTVAKAIGIKAVALTGIGGGKLASIADVCIKAPESETYKVQELHLPIYHWLCAKIEEHFFS